MDRRDYLLPMPFIFTGMVNMILYNIGLGSENSRLRPLIFIICGVLYFLMSFEMGLKKHLLQREAWKFFIVPLLWFIFYGLAFYRFGIQGMIRDSFLRFGVFCLSAFAVGIYMVRDKKERRGFLLTEKLSWLLMPTGILYVLMAKSMHGEYWARNLGAMTYMALSYTWMPAMFAILINFTVDGFAPLDFHFGKVQFSLPVFFRILLALFFWFVIQVTSTRGAILGSLIFFVSLLFWNLAKEKDKKKKKRMSILLLLMIGFFGGMNLSFVPEEFHSAERMEGIVHGLSQGKVETSQRGILSEEEIEQLVQESQPLQNPYWKSKNLITEDGQRMNIGDRMSLYKLAFAEIKSHPVKGMGAFGYHVKYGLYPHNFILEWMTDLGIVSGGILTLAVLILILRIFVAARKDRDVAMVMIFILGHGLMVLVSGSYFDMPFLFFGMGYGLYVNQREPKSKREIL